MLVREQNVGRWLFSQGEVGAVIALLALLALSAASCVPVGGIPAGGTGQVEWLHDWQAAMSKAEAESKPIMVNFYTDDFPACELLDRNTFTNNALTAFLNENFVNVKSNADTMGLGKFYSVEAVPTNLFTGPDGRPIGRTVGYRGPAKYHREALTMLDRWQRQAQ